MTTDQAAWRWRAYSTAILVTLAFAVLFAAVRYDPGDPESRLGGDYPAFYGAGSIVADGDWENLYSAERQQAAQAGYIDDDGGYLYFSYPPFVAAVYGLLAAFGYEWSFLLHTALMAAALFGAVLLVRPWLDHFNIPVVGFFAISLAFQPVLRSVLGGQNTTLTLLVLAGSARLDREGRPMLAGLVASFLLFKPQFGIVVLPLFLVARQWRMIGGWLLGAVALYLSSVMLVGGTWVADWWSQAGQFRDLNVAANGVHFISLPGFMENALGGGTDSLLLGYGVALVLGAVVAWYWWRSGADKVSPGASDVIVRWALVAVAVVLVAPQTLFYDGGVLLLALVAALPLIRVAPALAVGGLAAISWIQIAASGLGWSPLGPLTWLLAMAFLIAVLTGRLPTSAD